MVCVTSLSEGEVVKSCAAILWVLRRGEALGFNVVQRRSELSSRTVSKRLKDLQEAGLVEKTWVEGSKHGKYVIIPRGMEEHERLQVVLARAGKPSTHVKTFKKDLVIKSDIDHPDNTRPTHAKDKGAVVDVGVGGRRPGHARPV